MVGTADSVLIREVSAYSVSFIERLYCKLYAYNHLTNAAKLLQQV